MPPPAQLEALDSLLWLGNGHQAAKITSQSQPTISRWAHHLAKHLNLGLRKVWGEWYVNGNLAPLGQARESDQSSRFEGRKSMRLEAGAISSRLLADSHPRAWILGRPDAINQPRSLTLLRQRVVDAWLCTSAFDLPDDPGPDLTVIELFRAPILLVASRQHPLAGQSNLAPADLSRFPSVGLTANWYPKSASQLKRYGLWRNPRHISHYRSQHWEGRTGDGHTLAYASPCMMALNPDLCPLDFDLQLEQSIALVVRQEHADHPRIQELLDNIQRRVGLLRSR
jgi:hypothetical protein